MKGGPPASTLGEGLTLRDHKNLPVMECCYTGAQELNFFFFFFFFFGTG
jgi:hypothetical protein